MTPYILIVEDEQDDLAWMKMQLERRGVRTDGIRHAFCGLEAVEYLARAETLPALIIMDYDMYPMNGAELHRYLNRHKKYKKLPMLRVTGRYKYEEVRVELYKDNADFFPNLVEFIKQHVPSAMR